jgi:hypothetical protein
MSSEFATALSNEQRWWHRIPFARAIALFVALRLVTLAVVAFANLFTHKELVNDLSIWDGAWFLKAVYHGYPSHLPMSGGHVLANPIALFPVFTLCMRWTSNFTGLSAPDVGLVLSALTGLLAVVAVGRLTREFSDQASAERAALLFALAPGSFVFNLIYNEGLVIALCALGLVALLQRRWVLAGLIGAVATATSPVGLVFAASCAVSALVAIRTKREWRSLAAPMLAPIGFIAWMGYLWVHTGNLRAWQLTERDGWNSFPSLLYPFRILGKFLSNPLSPTMTGQILFFGTVISILGLVVVFKERLPVELKTFATCAVLLFATASPVGLRPRFVMLAFPLTIAAARRWSGKRFRELLIVSAVLLALMSYEMLTSFAVFP